MLRNKTFLAVLLFAATHAAANSEEWTFVDVTAAAGFTYQHGYGVPTVSEPRWIAGGAAAADYDGDGLIDLYVVRGDVGANLLFRNRGDGTFAEVGAAAGVDLEGFVGSGPLFADLTGDGLPDLFVGAVEGSGLRLYKNMADGTFADMTVASGLPLFATSYSASAADADRDGDLDLFLSPWIYPTSGLFWRNRGGGVFDDASAALPADAGENAFAVNFTDLDADGWPDLLVAADFGSSRVYRNLRDTTFEEVTTGVISDENGMGAAVGDYDRDGDLDWFVTSIWDPNGAEGGWGVTGNRLYTNTGDGIFADTTDAAGVRVGYWGWGACFADFDNDGHLDLFHVNGFPTFEAAGIAPEFQNDRSPLFMSRGDGSFIEAALEHGLVDTGQGRGLVCFDFDRDGDLDLFVANNSQAPKLYRNEGLAAGWLGVRLAGPAQNRRGVGAWVSVTSESGRQLREIRAGGNFASQNPAEAHFGLGADQRIEEVEVRWPDGEVSRYGSVGINQLITLGPIVLRDGFESGDTCAWESP